MPGLCRVRVCAVGTEGDMLRLNRVLLENVDEYEEPDDRPPYSLKELYDAVLRYTAWEKGEGATFVYGMISPHVFGRAERGTYEMLRLNGELYAALFTYECTDGVQQEDWMALHKQCGHLPMFVMYASAEFDRPKGEMILSNGQLTEDWTRMPLIWFYLFEDYEAGLVDEDAILRLRTLEKTLHASGFMDVAALLDACRENLTVAGRGLEIKSEELQHCIAEGRYAHQLALQRMVADGLLWDCPRNARRIACLDYVIDAWKNRDNRA